MKQQQEFKDCSVRLKALADPTRLRLVQYLYNRESGVTNLCEVTGLNIVKVSHHLQVLKRAEIVTTERRGKEIFYTLHPDLVDGKSAGCPALDFGCCLFELK